MSGSAADEPFDPGGNSVSFGPSGQAAPAGAPSEPFDPGGTPTSILGTSYSSVGGTGKGKPVPIEPSGSKLVDRSNRRAAGRAAALDLFTGNDSVRHPEIGPVDMPGLGLGVTDPKAWGIVGNMALSPNETALGNAIKSRIPGATIAYDDLDAEGHPAPGARLTVQVPGGPKMYLDRPGFNAQKGLFYGGQTAAALATGGRSLPLQMGAGGAQHALSQAGSYLLGGEEKPFDMLGTAISTLMPAGLSGLGYGVMKGIDRLSRPVIGTAEDIANRARTLHNWGFNPTEGTVTADPTKVAYEDFLANSGSSSDAARTHLKGLNDSNAEQHLQNKRTIIGNASGEVAPGTHAPETFQPTASGYGDRVNTAIAGRVRDLTTAERAAWDRLGPLSPDTAAGRGVVFSPDVSTTVMGRAANTLREFFGAPQGPNGNYTAGQLQETGQAAVNAFDQLRRIMLPVGADGRPTMQGFNLGNLQDMRQTLRNVIEENQGKPAAAVATRMRIALDDAITAAETTPGHMAGNPQLLTDFRTANAATRARYAFTEPRDNPAAERLISGVTNPAAPHTGQETVNSIFGSGAGTVTPGGGTNAALSHLQFHLGDEARQPLAGALTLRTLYGKDAATEIADTGAPRFDYNSAAGRIGDQVHGGGADVSRTLLPAEMQRQLADYRQALIALGVGSRAGGQRLNPSGSGYTVGTVLKKTPWIGPILSEVKPTLAAQKATQRGAEITQRAVGGANTAADLGVTLPRGPSTLNDPAHPYLSWMPGAQRAAAPLYKGGGLLGSQLFTPDQNQP